MTQVTVSDLAEAAGVARGTVYNNFKTIESLFEDVATQLTGEMQALVLASFAQIADPALRLTYGIRLFLRRAHEEPQWARFLVRFGATTPTLRELLRGGPMSDLKMGVEIKRFHLRAEQLEAAVGMISGGVLAAMSLILEGHRTWRDVGTDVAELALRALGLSGETARSMATAELPALTSAPRRSSEGSGASSRTHTRPRPAPRPPRG